MSSALWTLAQRVEGSPAANRAIDRLIGDTLGGKIKYESRSALFGAFTGSLDAAALLLPTDAMWRVGHDGEGHDPSRFKAEVVTMAAPQVAVADTPALALCAAALRVRALVGGADVPE